MSTSGNAWRKVALHYGIAALGCVAFNFIYAQFAHGVASPFMTFMFAIPLGLGALPAFALSFAPRGCSPIAPEVRQAWGLAVATLTVASCLHGVFDIAGTASPWLVVYVVTAAVFVVAAAAFAFRSVRESRPGQSRVL